MLERASPGVLELNFLFYDLAAYYTDWMLSGVAPQITTDRIYYSMRTQDLRRVYEATGSVGPMKMPWPRYGLHQEIEMLAFLSAPAELEVTIGKHRYRKAVAGKGLATFAVPLEPGVAKFAIYRGGAKLVDLTAPFAIRALEASNKVPNVFYFGGSDRD